MTDKYFNIYQRLHAAMKDVSFIKKEDKKVNNQYSFVSHDAVTSLTREALHKQDVIYFLQDMKSVQEGNRTEVYANVVFVCIDKPEDKLVVPAFGYGIDTQDKGPGKAISYLVKYALLKTLALETGDDPEKDNIEHTPGTKRPGKINPIDKTGNRAVDDAFKSAMIAVVGAFDKESLDKVAPYQRKILEQSHATQEQKDLLDAQVENKYLEFHANDPFAF